MLKKLNGKLNKELVLNENYLFFRLYREALKQAVSFTYISETIQSALFIS
jgi:hypothetical protein